MESALHAHINQVVAITNEEFTEISPYFAPRTFKKYHYLLQAGEPAPIEFFVVHGLLKSSYVDSSGKVHILQFAMEGWWISDFTAFNLQTLATLSIDCIEKTEVLTISFENKEKLCEASQKMAYFFRKKYAVGNAALQRRLLSLLSASATERYHSLVRQYPELNRRVPKSLLAAYLGVTRETLSRLSRS
ncbi:Crp/Fnr family transcriptional regulator [Spirosoma flavum]|uniref:Crp/Fnr family transcriptional regulator n=1 Tax=Spirosoma flavum TaxID=2048557 RepID=A0ABW6APT7_9BACT